MSCAFCGRENEAESRFCMDCGKPINLSAARVGPAYVPRPSGGPPRPYVTPAAATRVSAPDGAPQTRETETSKRCLRCAKPVNPSLPFCAHCGTRVTRTVEQSGCSQCGSSYTKGVDLFCARCGNDLRQRVSADAPRSVSAMLARTAARRDARAAPRPLDSRDQARDLASRSSARRTT